MATVMAKAKGSTAWSPEGTVAWSPERPAPWGSEGTISGATEWALTRTEGTPGLPALALRTSCVRDRVRRILLIIRDPRTPRCRTRSRRPLHPPHSNALTVYNMLNRHVPLIRRRLLVPRPLLLTSSLPSHPVLPHLRVVGAFIRAHAVRLDLAGVEGRHAVLGIA